VGRLEDSLAKALAAQSTAAAELIEEKRARAVEAGSLKAALEVARGRVSEVQRRMASVEENNERLLQEQEVGLPNARSDLQYVKLCFKHFANIMRH